MLRRHARLYAGHPRLSLNAVKQDVDGWDKPGHDVDGSAHNLSAVMPGFMPGTTSFLDAVKARRGWPGQARPWRGWVSAQPLRRHARLYAGHPRLSWTP